MSTERRMLGSGVLVGSIDQVEGKARFVAGVETVIELMQEDVGSMILLVEDASATALAPIIGDARAVVCTSGGPTSHLALVAREFGVPCVVGALLSGALTDLDDAWLTITADGSIAADLASST